jgi:hypothetical protein
MAAAMRLLYTRPFDPKGGPIYDCEVWRGIQRGEIVRTLEVADSATVGTFGVLFARFSIRANLYRRSHWLRQVGNTWAVTTEYAARNAIEDVPNGEDLIRKAEQWSKESTQSSCDDWE